MELKRGIDAAVSGPSPSRAQQAEQAHPRLGQRSPRSAPSRPTTTRTIGKMHCRRHGEGRPRRRHHGGRGARAIDTELDVVEGMQFDRGYLSPYFVTDPDRDGSCNLEEPLILLHEKKIANMKDLLPAARAGCPPGSSPLLIVAEDIEGEALATLVVNKIRGTLNVAASEGPRLRRSPQGHAPGHGGPHGRPGHRRGARSQARERDPQGSGQGQSRIVIDKDNTTVIDGAGTKKADRGSLREIRGQIEGHHVRLRPKRSSGAPRQAGRRCRRHEGRCGHREPR